MYIAITVMATLGGVLGLILAIASKKFHVDVDARVDEAIEALPGINCGACGFPGCAGYAEAVVLSGADITLCAPGGKATARGLARIMGMDPVEREASLATCSCQKSGVQVQYNYIGIRSCKAAAMPGIAGGPIACRYGCLGLGDCVTACLFGALLVGDDGLVHINESNCTGCKKCVSVCPRTLMRIDPESRVVYIKCMNHDKGAVAGKLCNHACIACRKCVKECPFEAIEIINNLAVIDYDKCKNCGKCVKVCPKSVIVSLRAERRERKKGKELEAQKEEV